MEPIRTTPLSKSLRACGSLLATAVTEALWPTRCAVCDEPGQPLCEKCRRELPYIDWWLACPKCGSPFGRIQCCDCNSMVLESLGRRELPYQGARSVVALSERSKRIVTTYKDQGERILAETMAQAMAIVVPPEWRRGVVSFVPASSAARRRRGFDHAELLAREVSLRLELPLAPLLQRPYSKDQRLLTRKERWENMQRIMSALPGVTMPSHILLIDDVLTTGSTLFSASDALRKAGAVSIHCLTFARAW